MILDKAQKESIAQYLDIKWDRIKAFIQNAPQSISKHIDAIKTKL